MQEVESSALDTLYRIPGPGLWIKYMKCSNLQVDSATDS